LFEGVPADFAHNGVLWIETLTTKRVDMRSDACPPRGEHRRFSPNDPLRRVDFIRALLELQRWDLILKSEGKPEFYPSLVHN
jgi:hypothetical protein